MDPKASNFKSYFVKSNPKMCESNRAVLHVIEGAGVLLLLSVFFAYVLAPALPPIRRRVRVGRRRRPISDAAAIILIYFVLFVPGAFLWRMSEPAVKHWVAVTAPPEPRSALRGRR